MKLQVCILTFRRPQLLEAALLSVREQRFTSADAPEVTVLVVDNDECESGRGAFDRLLGETSFARYVVATPQGISRARNRALEESVEADFVVFLDDDETASPFWLQELLNTQQRCQADVVTGPVVPVFERQIPWIIRGGYFQPRRLPSGTEVAFVATNNTLLRRAAVSKFRFDLRFDRTGSEDTYFFMQLRQQGVRCIWSDEALVYETVPLERMTVRWLLQRARNDAKHFTRCCLYSEPCAATFLTRLMRALGAAIAATALFPAAFMRKDRLVRALRLLQTASGTIDGLVSYVREYGTSRRSFSPQ